MTPQDFDLLLGRLVNDEVDILSSKGHDYTDNGEGNEDEDRLFNFKEVGKRLGISPLLVWGIYWTKHNNAIEKFIRTGAVASEPIEERIKDARNYLALGAALIEDLRDEEEDKPTDAQIWEAEIESQQETPEDTQQETRNTTPQKSSFMNKLLGGGASAPTS